jgi:AAA ATPase domain
VNRPRLPCSGVVTAVWRLRGRDTELSELGVLLRRRRSALLAGPSGVGKTSLAMAAAAELEPSGSAVVRVVASQPTAGVPLGALAVLLPPTRLPRQGSVTASAQVRAGIVAIAGDGPALLVVDDAQWLDEASAVVVHQLVAQGHVAVLATLRTGVLAPAPVTALWKDGLVERVDVAPLGDAAVREVLETALGGPVETLTASRLWRRCSGNVLYLRELVGEAERLGLLQQRDGVWCIDTLPPGSPRLAELVGARLDALDELSRARGPLAKAGVSSAVEEGPWSAVRWSWRTSGRNGAGRASRPAQSSDARSHRGPPGRRIGRPRRCPARPSPRDGHRAPAARPSCPVNGCWP